MAAQRRMPGADASFEASRRLHERRDRRRTMATNELPIAVIGGGPVGLAAAAHLMERGLRPVVFEAGERVGQAMREWGHVRMFSPWRYVVDHAARRALAPTGWVAPDEEALPTGLEVVEQYLEPLAALP